METNAAASAPAQTLDDRTRLEQATSGGANWFYWIAALSMINSMIIMFGGGWGFIVGLGVTQFIDAIAVAVGEELGSGAGGAIKAVALAGDALVAGVFALFGYLAGRGHGWAFVVGMVLYACDGLLFLLVGDFLSLGFHGFALFGIFAGFAAHRKLAALGPPVASGETVAPQPITP